MISGPRSYQSTSNGRSRTRVGRRSGFRRQQAGFGLLEAIIGVVMVALIIGAGTTGLQTLQQTSSGANQVARLDAVLVGAGEAIRQAEYIDCAQPEQYEDALDDQGRPQDSRLLQETGNGTPQVIVDSIDKPGCPGADPGRQTVVLKASQDGRIRTASISKIDPFRRLLLPTAVIDPEHHLTGNGDIQAVYTFTANQSKSEVGLVAFEWDCGDQVTPGSEQEFTYNDANDPKFCKYQADTVPKVVQIKLKVTDSLGQSDEATKSVTIQPRTDPRPPPVAQAAGTPTTIYAGQTVTFSSAGSAAPAGSIASYNWGFDDFLSGAANNSWLENPTHTFYQARSVPFAVTLTVTDDVGLTATSVILVTVSALPIPLPSPTFDDPGSFFAPAAIQFDGFDSTDHAGDPVTSYEWNFGDNSPTGSGGDPIHQYTSDGTFVVTLTVEDSGRRKASYSREILIRAMDPPSNFQAIGSRSQIPRVWPFTSGRTGYMDFGWTAVPVGPGESVSLVISLEGIGVSPCMDAERTKVVSQTGTGYQTARWEVSSLEVTFETFCAGTTYQYTVQIRKTLADGSFVFGPQMNPRKPRQV